MKDFIHKLHEMDNDIELRDQVADAVIECKNIFREHIDEIDALMAAITRCYFEFCDKYDIERETGMMMLHAEQLLYLTSVDVDSIPPLDEED